MHIDLYQPLRADAFEAVNLSCFDHQDVAGTSLEFLAIYVVQAAAGADELHFVVRVAMRPGTAARRTIKNENGNADVASISTYEMA